MIKIPQNTTIVDVAFNLSGSLAGLPAVLSQLPVGERIGFDALPAINEDVTDTGQTWTPDLRSMDLELTSPVYNANALLKSPFTTDLAGVQVAIDFGNDTLLNR